MNRHGFALLEVVAALAITGTAGLALLEMSGGALRLVASADTAERELADADRLMAAYTLLDRRDLEQRLGTRLVGPYQVRVARQGWDVFIVEIRAGAAPATLTTALYRVGQP